MQLSNNSVWNFEFHLRLSDSNLGKLAPQKLPQVVLITIPLTIINTTQPTTSFRNSLFQLSHDLVKGTSKIPH